MGHLAGMQNWVVYSNINKLAIPSLASVKLLYVILLGVFLAVDKTTCMLNVCYGNLFILYLLFYG